MRGNVSLCGIGVVLTVFLLTFIAPGQVQAAEKTVVKMVGTLPIQHHLTKALEIYRDIVEKKAGGRVTFQLYPAQQLYSDKDLVMVLPKGAVEAAIINPDMWSGLVPSQGIFYFSCYYPSRDHFFRLFKDGIEAWEMVKKDFEAKNVKILSHIEYGSQTGITKKPIAKMEDMKGLRIRAQGEYIAVFLQTLGAAPVVTSSAEVYLMLQRGTVDGAWSGPSTFVDRKWFEVAKYFLTSDTGVSSTFLLAVNLDFWKKLPPDLQKIFQDAALEVQDWTWKKAAEGDVEYRKILKEKGITFTSLDEKEKKRWHDKVAPEMEATYKKAVGEEKAKKILESVRKTCF